MLKLALFVGALVLMTGAARAQDWSPVDPHQLDTKVDFTVAWARDLRGFYSLEDIQRLAKAKGQITERNLSDDDPSVTYHFRGSYLSHVSYMTVVVKRSGYIGVSILTDNNTDIVLNNSGGFNCDLPGGHYADMGDHCPR